MLCQSLSGIFNTVLLVCTWIVFMVIEVQAIPNHKYVQCQEMLERITRHTEVLEVYVNPEKLQACIVLWAKWRDELIRHGGLSFPTPRLLEAELKQMLTQQAKQAGHDPSEQVEQPNVAAHQPQEGQSKAKRLKVEPPARPWDFIHRQQQPVSYLKPKSPQATASKQEQDTGSSPALSEKFEQPNKVAGVQQPQSSQVTHHKVTFELDKVRTNHPSNLQSNLNEPSLSRAPPVIPPSPERPRLGQVAPEQPNVVVTMQQPQSSVVTLREVIRELVKMQDDQPRRGARHVTMSTDCMTLVDAVLGTQNPLIPTEMRSQDHFIVQDCIKVWEKLRDKAADNQQKQNALENELRLMTQRLKQVLEVRDARTAQQKAETKARADALIDACHQLARNPLNLETATMEQMQQYKIDLDDCILRWKKLVQQEYTPKKYKSILMVELGTMRSELTRVKNLIRNRGRDQGQNVAAGAPQVEGPVDVGSRKRPSGSQVIQLNAKFPKVASSSVLDPLYRLKPQYPPSAASGKEPGPSGGGSNRNFDIPWRHRSKHSKKVRNRMAKSKPK